MAFTSYHGLGFLAILLILVQLFVAGMALYGFNQCESGTEEHPCQSAIVNSWMWPLGILGAFALLSFIVLVWSHSKLGLHHLSKLTMPWSVMHASVMLALTGGLAMMSRDGCASYDSETSTELADTMRSVALSGLIGGSVVFGMAIVGMMVQSHPSSQMLRTDIMKLKHR